MTKFVMVALVSLGLMARTGVAQAGAQQVFSIPNSGTAQWVKLGTFTASQMGYNVSVHIVSSQGFNATNSQDQVSDIQFKSSNGSSVDENGFAGDSWWHTLGPNASAPSSIKWVANASGVSATTFTLYAYFAAWPGAGSFYVVSVPSGTTWTNYSVGGQTDPGSGSATVLIPTNQMFIGSSVVVNAGVSADGSGFKHVRTNASCETGASVGSTCNIVVDWPGSPFADANYTATCNVKSISGNGTGGASYSFVLQIEDVNKSAESMTVVVVNLSNDSPLTVNGLNCIAIHD